ncbi:MAG: transglycosylase SLT domain-containing protein [Candidatus Cyclobacteriaceae bacterium M2_1C_046]
MKYFAVGISILSLIIVLGYIQYNEKRNKGFVTRFEVNEYSRFPDRPNARSLALPESMSFAGEEVPLHKPHVRERLYRELLVNTYWHSNTLLLIAEANRWLPAIEKILMANGLPTDFKYIPVIEGSLRNDISPAGAVGFWQLLAATARENGLEVNDQVDERYHPLKSTDAASRYIKKAYKNFESWTDVAASYNRGVAGLRRAMNTQQTGNYYDLYLNDETTRYVYRILAVKLILENPDKYGFDISEEHLFNHAPVREIVVDKSINSLPEFARDHGVSYGILKYYNPWLRDYKLSVSRGESYIILLPEAPG